ncbi:uncharacterized protein LOC143026325 [Oratosquilla oratoria]|uniref:uncharacterized protein LOC143026325 n=1 Tax=Oratosquilla oratoria TaxID=337810 RepID=UPI003F77461E
MTKNDLRDKLDGDELDLALLNLSEVPVKEIAALPRAVKIDLSNNQLSSLPLSFAKQLSHITRLELGSNKLTELPSNFGNLKNLRHLDLYNNKLEDLPVSLCQLTNLRWLDVKNNPLNPKLKSVLGDCLNQKECEIAAKNLIVHLKKVESELEREKQKKLKEERDREAMKHRQEEEEKARKRAEKKAAKERKKAEAQAQAKPVVVNGSVAEKEKKVVEETTVVPQKKAASKKSSISCLGIMNWILFILLLVGLGGLIYVHTEGDLSVDALLDAVPRIISNGEILIEEVANALSFETLQEIPSRFYNNVIIANAVAVNEVLIEYGVDLVEWGKVISEFLSEVWRATYDITTDVYEWANDNLDIESIKNGIMMGFTFLYEQLLVVKEELGKNEAFMSATEPIRHYGAVIVETASDVLAPVWGSISWIFVYIQEEGPGMLSVIQEQATSVYTSARDSIQELVK